MPEPTSPKDHYDSLKTEIDGYIKYSHRWSIVWAIVYYILRGTLIVLAACVAAKDSLPRIASVASLLSLLPLTPRWLTAASPFFTGAVCRGRCFVPAAGLGF